MSLNLNITADSVYGIVATVSSNIPTEITINATGTNIALGQLITSATAFTSYNANWNNQGGFAGLFYPGNTYAVYAADTQGNTVNGSITLTTATLTIGFTTGTAYANISLAAMNSILGTTYGTLTRTWDAVNQTNIYVLGTSTVVSQNIRASAFLGNNPGYLKYVKDYGTVATIGNSAFAGANQLTSIVFPWTTQIGNNVFENGVAISNINFASLTSVGSSAFANLDATLSTIVMRGTTSTQSLFGSIPTARYVPTYVINTDTFPSLTLIVDRNVATTGTSILVQSSATNIMDGFVVTASIYSSLLKSFYNTTTFTRISSGISGGTLTVPNSLADNDTVYVVYDYSRSTFPLYNVNFNAGTNLYVNAPISPAIQLIPKITTYATPVTQDTYYTVAEGSSSQPVPINVTGYYNTSTVSTLASTSTPHPGTLTIGGNGYTIYFNPDPIFNGQDSFTFSVVGRNGQISNQSTVYITVTPSAVSILPNSLWSPKSNSGNKFTQTFTASNGVSPYTFSVGGNVPSGLTISSASVTTAVLTGTTTSTVGTYNFYVRATDSSYPSTSSYKYYTLQVFPSAPNANPSSLTINENSPATLVPLNFTGNPATISTVTNAQYGTTIVSGATVTYQPYQGFSGVDSFNFRGTNVSGTGNISTATITVTPSTITFSLAANSVVPPPSPIVKKYYQSPTIFALGGFGTYQFSATGLPPGITLLFNKVATLQPQSLSSGTGYTTATNLTTIGGSGSGLTVDITTNVSGNIKTVLVNQPGKNYAIGDVVTIVQSGHTPNATIAVASLSLGFTFSETPTVVGLYNPIITVHDSGNPVVYSTTTYVLNVAAGPTVIGSANYDSMQQATSGIAQLVKNLYNTTPYSSPVSSGQLIKASDWTKLYDDMERAYIHQNGPGDVASDFAGKRAAFATSSTVLAASTASLLPKISSLISNYKSVASGQLTTYAFSLTTSTNTSTIGGYSFTWPDDDSAQAFFNLGGYIESDFDNSIFTLTNYSKTIFTVVTGTVTTPSVGAGTQQVFIEGNGSNINFIVDIVSNDQISLVSTTNSIRYHASNADTGGIAATLPYVQLITNTLGPFFGPPSLLQVYGNDVTTSSIFISNQGVLPVNIISVVPIHDPNYASEPLTLNVISYPWGGTLGAFGQSSAKGPLVFSWQNNNENGGRGFYVNSVAITYTQGLQSQTIIIPTPVQTNFGIKAIPGVPTVATATADYYIPYTFKGYGGVLDTNYGINPRVGGFGFSISSFGPSYYVPDAPPITVKLDTNLVPNYTTSTWAYFQGRDTYNEYYTTSTNIILNVNVKDQHIGSWFSPQNANNGVIGMSYDIINGDRCLTIGFGMGSGGSNQLVVDATSAGFATYSGMANGDAGNPNKNSLKQLNRKFLGLPRNFVRYSGTSTLFTNFIQDYGVWNPTLFDQTSNTSFDQTYLFLVRGHQYGLNNVRYNYNWQADSTAPTTFTISGIAGTPTAGYSQVITTTGGSGNGSYVIGGTYPMYAGYYIIRIQTPSDTNYRPAVAFRIWDNNWPKIRGNSPSDSSTIWSTLDPMAPTWAEISRITLKMDGNPVTYYPGVNIFSSGVASGVTYNGFFANNSMFTVNHDGVGGLSVSVNALDHTSGQAVTDQTLVNVAFLPYYYSNYEPSAGFNDRYSGADSRNGYQWDGKAGNGSYTPYFKGFDANGLVLTTSLATPQALQPGTYSDPNIQFAAAIVLETVALINDLQSGITIDQYLTNNTANLVGSLTQSGDLGLQTTALDFKLAEIQNLPEALAGLNVAYIDAAAIALTVLGANNSTAKALSEAYMAISAIGAAATALAALDAGLGIGGAIAAVASGSSFLDGIGVLIAIFFCFPEDAEISMEDGSTKLIKDVKPGDRLIGAYGEINTVLATDSHALGNRHMYKINNEHATTSDHPHLGIDNKFYGLRRNAVLSTFGKLLKVNTLHGTETMSIPTVDTDRIEKMELGTELKTIDGSKIVNNIVEYTAPPETLIYSLKVDGSHTFYANGYAVGGWINDRDFDYTNWIKRLSKD